MPTAPPQDSEAVAVNSTTIKFTWTPPPQQFINGINQGYKVQLNRSDMFPSLFWEFVLYVLVTDPERLPIKTKLVQLQKQIHSRPVNIWESEILIVESNWMDL